MTQEIKKHLETVNEGRARPVKLRLGGHSLGGGLATYAALKNDVPAVVLAPMRLGMAKRLQLRADVLAKASRNAPGTNEPLVTAVTVQGDWVADPSLGRISGAVRSRGDRVVDGAGTFGKVFLLPRPTPEQVQSVPRGKSLQDSFSAHNHIHVALEVLANSQDAASARPAG